MKVQKLRTSLHAKAKAEPNYRFYTLWDKVCHEKVLSMAYRLCRRKGGAAGVDNESFEDITPEKEGPWLGKLQEELRSKTYRPLPLLRVWIPKSSGGQRPLGIPAIRDRVAQMAALLILGPIFEADFQPMQYGFRPGLDAKMAVRKVYFHITSHGRREVVDADLSDYFNTIPHGPLVKCLIRRVADGNVLSLIKQWLEAPVMERKGHDWKRTTEGKDGKRGVPQGGVISPLLSTIYFRRFILAWYQFGIGRELDAQVVNYADDLVICCKPGNGPKAMAKMRELVERLGLKVNEKKTRLAEVPKDTFDFLGYTFGQMFDRHGKPYIGTKPSKKAVTRLLQKVHDATSVRWTGSEVEERVTVLNRILRGWSGYFDQGPVMKTYRVARRYTERRLRRWLIKKHKQGGTGYRQYPDEVLYGKLGLYKLPERRSDLPRAKA